MAAERLMPATPIDLLAMVGAKPVAYILDLPLTIDEVIAYQAIQAGTGTDRDKAVFTAWVVAMTLAHGTWVAERFRLDQAGDASSGD